MVVAGPGLGVKGCQVSMSWLSGVLGLRALSKRGLWEPGAGLLVSAILLRRLCAFSRFLREYDNVESPRSPLIMPLTCLVCCLEADCI